MLLRNLRIQLGPSTTTLTPRGAWLPDFRFEANSEQLDASCLGTLRAIPCGWNSCCRL